MITLSKQKALNGTELSQSMGAFAVKQSCSTLQPRIYVVCLDLAGDAIPGAARWIRISAFAKTFIKAVSRLCRRYQAQSFEIEDAKDCGFIDAHESLKRVHKKAVFVMQHGEAALAAWHFAEDLRDAKRRFKCDYQGVYNERYDFAVELFNRLSLDQIPLHLRQHIDYQSFCTEIFDTNPGYQAINIKEKIHVFRSHPCDRYEW